MKHLLVVALLWCFWYSPEQDELSKSMERGKKLYTAHCATCHMDDGQGTPPIFPPLAKSDYLMEDLNRSILIVRDGLEGEITVNGIIYNMPMQGITLTDQEVADIMNYVRNSWGNKGKVVTAGQVYEVLNSD